MQLLLYILIFPFLWFLSILPTRILYVFSTFIYFWIYYVFGYRKKVVNDNLNLCFPEKSKKEIKTIEKKFYQHMCDMLVESIKSISISEAEIKRRFKVTNIEEIHKVEKTNKYFDRLVRKIRAKYNTYLITNKETTTILRQHKTEGKKGFYGFITDQSPKITSTHYWKEFMNIKVPVHTGAEKLSKELDMAVMFFKTKKVKRGYYETTFKTVTLNPNEYEDYQITDMFFTYLEELINEAPEYYLWTHKRWKHKDKVPKEFQ